MQMRIKELEEIVEVEREARLRVGHISLCCEYVFNFYHFIKISRLLVTG